jgi:hypothetical protein
MPTHAVGRESSNAMACLILAAIPRYVRWISRRRSSSPEVSGGSLAILYSIASISRTTDSNSFSSNSRGDRGMVSCALYPFRVLLFSLIVLENRASLGCPTHAMKLHEWGTRILESSSCMGHPQSLYIFKAFELCSNAHISESRYGASGQPFSRLHVRPLRRRH